MFSISSAPRPRQDTRWGVAISITIHLAVVYAAIADREAAPIAVVENASPTVSFFEIAPLHSEPAPAAASTSTIPTLPLLELPDLRVETTFAASTGRPLPSVTPQEIDLSALGISLPGLMGRGSRTTLPVLVNQEETERTLRERVESLQIPSDTVDLHLLIDERGQVREWRIAGPSGDERFDRIATEVIRDIGRFLPAHQDGVPVTVWVGFPVSVEQIAPSL